MLWQLICCFSSHPRIRVHWASINLFQSVESWIVIAWKNSWHFVTPLVVSSQNDVWEMSARIPTNQTHYADLGNDMSSAWNFCPPFRRCHFARKPAVVSWNVGWILRLGWLEVSFVVRKIGQHPFPRLQTVEFERPAFWFVTLYVSFFLFSIEGEFVPKEGDVVSFRTCPLPPKNVEKQAVMVVIQEMKGAHERWWDSSST